MSTRNQMKSVIAQGSTVVKAIEEALKKAGMPTQFFVKLLEDAQSGFLGFGAKKAKIALFFKQKAEYSKNKGILSQESYESLFNNQSLSKQIEEELKILDTTKTVIHNQAPKEQKSKINTSPLQPKKIITLSNHKPDNNNPTNHFTGQSRKQQIPHKHPETKKTADANSVKKHIDVNKKEVHHSQNGQRDINQTKQNQQLHKNAPSAQSHNKPLSQTKLTIRPLLQKNNDPKKSE